MELQPLFSNTEAQSRNTFMALTWALSYPGRITELPPNATAWPDNFQTIGQALLDLETTFYTPDKALKALLLRTTARKEKAKKAAYQFYPEVNKKTLEKIAKAPVGDMTFPDQGATLILGCKLGTGRTFQLSGPGIQTTTEIQVDDIPIEFWAYRESAIRYPLGWDVFLIDGSQVVGLPRTTKITFSINN